MKFKCDKCNHIVDVFCEDYTGVYVFCVDCEERMIEFFSTEDEDDT